jgi:hypothetical protein
MKNETFSGTMESAYGKTLETAIPFSGNYNAYSSVDEVKAANDYPSDKEIVDFRNAQRKATEVQKARTAALDAAGIIKPTLENDEQLRLRGLYKILKAAGKSHDEARTTAAATLNAEWADDYGSDE